jgi:hypothetical protein
MSKERSRGRIYFTTKTFEMFGWESFKRWNFEIIHIIFPKNSIIYYGV